MSEVLQAVQEDFEKASTRPLLNDVIHKLQKLIADDLQLRSERSLMAFKQKYPNPSHGFSEQGNRTANEFYRDECVEFSFVMLTDLDRMYAETARALYNAMSQPLPSGSSENYLATEMFRQCENFKWTFKHMISRFDATLPKKPFNLTRVDLARQQDMGNIHVLLTRLKGV